jgi:hypothetical protein
VKAGLVGTRDGSPEIEATGDGKKKINKRGGYLSESLKSLISLKVISRDVWFSLIFCDALNPT